MITTCQWRSENIVIMLYHYNINRLAIILASFYLSQFIYKKLLVRAITN